jgi:hypothetical protein
MLGETILIQEKEFSQSGITACEFLSTSKG